MKTVRIALSIVGIAAFLYHMVYTQYLLQGPVHHMNTHLGFALLLTFLNTLDGKERNHWRIVLISFILLSLITVLYIQLQIDDLQDRAWFNSSIDLVIGAILIILVIEGTRQAFGLVVPILTIIVIIYPFFGRYFPEPFYSTYLPLDKTISNLSVALSRGIYGTALSISAGFVFLWVIFGSVLQATGATNFFLQLGRLVGAKFRGGSGLMAVASSAAVGSITGSISANIVITGSFTIPLMKKTGFSPAQAGAIEAAASNGGQIMPPIMGVAAFAMAGLTGIPYVKIVAMAIAPAMIYFSCCAMYIYLQARKRQIAPIVDKVDVKMLISSSYLFLFPLALICVLLILDYTVMYVAFWAIFLTLILSVFSKKTRPSLRTILDGLARGAIVGGQIGTMCACIGLIVSTLTMTGLGVKLSTGIEAWSGGHILPALVMISAVCLLMGLGGITLTAYILVAMFAAPPLMKMGVSIAQAHFFVMFVSVFAFITPPVAIGALVASKIAGSNYIETAIEAVKVASAAFLLPLMFIYCPIIILQPQEKILAVMGIIAGLGYLAAVQFAFVGFFVKKCSRIERILWFFVSIVLITYIVLQDYRIFILGISLFILLFSYHWKIALQKQSADPARVVGTADH